MPEITISEEAWSEAYNQLQAYVSRLVHRLQVPNWRGQEDDVAWDIVQESMRRFVEYTQQAERNEREPVRSMIALLKIIARNYCSDLRRREWRLQREDATLLRDLNNDAMSFSEVAIENAYRARIFRTLAREIAAFPQKQQKSLLNDLALCMAFEDDPTPLDLAFQAEGISLKEYRVARAADPIQRSRDASLRNYAYKRLGALGGAYTDLAP